MADSKRTDAAQSALTAAHARIAELESRGDALAGAATTEAWRKFETWFFRECNEGTRRHLFAIFDLPVDEIRNHGIERHALRLVRKALAAWESSR